MTEQTIEQGDSVWPATPEENNQWFIETESVLASNIMPSKSLHDRCSPFSAMTVIRILHSK